MNEVGKTVTETEAIGGDTLGQEALTYASLDPSSISISTLTFLLHSADIVIATVTATAMAIADEIVL